MQRLATESVQKRNLVPRKILPSRRASLYIYHVVIVHLDKEVYTRPEETCTEGKDDTLALIAFGVQEGSGYRTALRETFRARAPVRQRFLTSRQKSCFMESVKNFSVRVVTE